MPRLHLLWFVLLMTLPAGCLGSIDASPSDDDSAAAPNDDDSGPIADNDDDSPARVCSLSTPCDEDGDGVDSIECGGMDCDDTDPSRSPDLFDLPDGRDNDCDSEVDEVVIPGSWVHIPRGEFLMGCGPNEAWCAGFAGGLLYPHEVCIKAMWLSRTEVTVNQYGACRDAGVCGPPALSPQPDQALCAHAEDEPSDLPMDCIAWNQATDYCRWIGGQLPTEAQWERAARGPDRSTFPWGEEVPDCSRVVMRLGLNTDHANDGCGRGQTWPVEEKLEDQSGFGVLGLGGNVTEMVRDLYNTDAYRSHAYLDPLNSVPQGASADGPVVRGGNAAGSHFPQGQFNSFFNGWRSSLLEKSVGGPRLGFRCVHPVGPRN